MINDQLISLNQSLVPKFKFLEREQVCQFCANKFLICNKEGGSVLGSGSSDLDIEVPEDGHNLREGQHSFEIDDPTSILIDREIYRVDNEDGQSINKQGEMVREDIDLDNEDN